MDAAGRIAPRRPGRASGMRDTIGGTLLIATGAALFWFGRTLPMGQGTRLGPGYVPRVLAILIAVMGIVILVRALASPGERISPANPRAVGLVLGSIVLFGLLLETAGLVAASAALLLVSAAAAPDFRAWQALLFAIAMTAGAVALFVWGLGLSIKVLP